MSVFGGNVRNVTVCHVKPDGKVEDLLENVRSRLVEEVGKAARRCIK